MSHYAEIKLKMTGDAEAVARALAEMTSRKTGRAFGRENVEVHQTRQNLYGYMGDKRDQKAHVIVRRQHVGGSSNDIGFEKKADGSWIAHISDFDKTYYNASWQKRLLSKWAVERVGCEAEAQGYQWEKKESACKKYVYVNVIQNNGW